MEPNQVLRTYKETSAKSLSGHSLWFICLWGHMSSCSALCLILCVWTGFYIHSIASVCAHHFCSKMIVSLASMSAAFQYKQPSPTHDVFIFLFQFPRRENLTDHQAKCFSPTPSALSRETELLIFKPPTFGGSIGFWKGEWEESNNYRKIVGVFKTIS